MRGYGYQEKRRFGCLKGFFVSLLLLGIIALGILFLIERSFPDYSEVVEQLSELEKARLAEIIQLRQTLGNAAWPGWGNIEIPIILYNEEYAFLVGYPDTPPPGWYHARTNAMRGGSWEVVPDDTFEGQAYYRQRLPQQDVTPEDFIVRVGEQWVVSLKTKEWAEIYLIQKTKENLPPVLNSLFAYVFAIRSYNSDWHISLVLHETFHVYQAMTAAERFHDAETGVKTASEGYPWEDAEFRESWQRELNLLVEAVRAASDDEMRNLAINFLAQRENRRKAHNLAPELVAYERRREWLEGPAKYAELAIWQQVATASEYEPVPALKKDRDFKRYKTFKKHWNQEVDQIKRMAGDPGDVRFYYSGMAQGVLLDRLMPDWKTRIMEDDMGLEDLLRSAVGIQ